MSAFANEISNFIAQHQLMRRDGVYVVGLSGGPDSVALLSVLHSLGYRLHAAHCNFKLRGNESQRDEEYCVTLCHQLNIPLHRAHFDTAEYAALHHISIEMAARDLRYAYFNQLTDDLNADAIVIAHHRDDHVETVLLNLVRGTGAKGLVGIRAKRDRIIRPMLCVSRQDVTDYLAEQRLAYVTDSSNLTDEVRRNVLRHQVIPVLRGLNPKFDEQVYTLSGYMASMLQVAHHALTKAAERAKTGANRYRWDVLMQFVAPEQLLWHILGPEGFNAAQVAEIAKSTHTGKVWTTSKSVCFRYKEELHLADIQQWTAVPPTSKMVEEGVYRINSEEKIKIVRAEFKSLEDISRHPNIATLDADKVRFPLTLRAWQQGDRIVPYKMKGSKLVSDLLKEAQLSPLRRRQQLVLVDDSGQIVWLVGIRVSDVAAISPKHTKHILRIALV